MQKFMSGLNVLFVAVEMEARGLRRMADYLYIFGEKRNICREYQKIIYQQEKNYKTVMVIGEACGIKGYYPEAVDFLFTMGWWNRPDAQNILETIYTYVAHRRDCIIGDKHYIPPCFYREKKVVMHGQGINDRFELLDL